MLFTNYWIGWALWQVLWRQKFVFRSEVKAKVSQKTSLTRFNACKKPKREKKYVVSQIFVQSWNPKRLMKLSLCSVNVDCIRTKVWETTHSCLRKKRVVFRLMLTCRGANIRLFGVKSPVFEHDTNTGSCISGLGVRQAKTFTFFYRSRYFYDPPSPIEHYSYQSSRSTYFLVKMNVHTFSKDLFYLEV